MSKETRAFRYRWFSSLSGQLILSTILPVAISLLAIVAVGFLGYSRLLQTLVEQRDAELVRLAAQQVANHMVQAVELLHETAASDDVRSGQALRQQAALSARFGLRQHFDCISVVNAAGEVVATDGGELGGRVDALPYFRWARDGYQPVRSNLLPLGQGRQGIVIAVPIFDYQGQFAGIVCGTYDLQGPHLARYLQDVPVGTRGLAYLVGRDGRILWHPDASRIGTDNWGNPATAALLAGQAGAQVVDLPEGRIVLGYAPLEMTSAKGLVFADASWQGWGLVTQEQWDDIIAPLMPYVRLVIALLGLTVILPIVLLATGTRRATAPLRALAERVGHVADGDFQADVPVGGPAEVRELGRSFNDMVCQLQRYRDDIQRYLASILNAQEEERKRIARELHDDTAQALVILGRRIESCEEMLDDPQRLRQELRLLRDLVDDALQDVRQFTHDLRPPLLEELGLGRSLELMAEEMAKRYSLRVAVQISGNVRSLTPELELTLYRLAQESLTNVCKHAQAQHAVIRLVYDEETVQLQVSDDGIGFRSPKTAAELAEAGRLGLLGMYERAQLFGGSLAIASAPNEGTTVTVVMPIPPGGDQ
ncbi:MAG: HAMP domain-containing protein [Chloroflexi bacterium]|nr:HAMP domain-containing protein [Chloroflexota bacterium]